MELQPTLAEFAPKFNWAQYNASQTREKLIFMRLLKELCQQIPNNVKRMNNPHAIPMPDAVFGLALKTYCNAVIRRFHSDLKVAEEAGYIERAYHFNTMKDHLHHPQLRNILKDLIETSSLPLKELESYFAADATGFSCSKFTRWFDVRTQQNVNRRAWRKCHAICGVISNIVTSVEITDGDVADTTQFKKLVKNTSENFEIEEVSADKGYLSRENMDCVDKLGAVPYIPFKSNSTGRAAGSVIWKKMFNEFQNKQPQFLRHYHKRSNIESVWSMIKARFGNNLRSKKEESQDNEILLKVLCHNLCVLIQEMHMRNLSISFFDSRSGNDVERVKD